MGSRRMDTPVPMSPGVNGLRTQLVMNHIDDGAKVEHPASEAGCRSCWVGDHWVLN